MPACSPGVQSYAWELSRDLWLNSLSLNYLSLSTIKLLTYHHLLEPVVEGTWILLFSLEKRIKVIGNQANVFSIFENSEIFSLGKEVEIPVDNTDYVQNQFSIFWSYYKAWQFILKSSVTGGRRRIHTFSNTILIHVCNTLHTH